MTILDYCFIGHAFFDDFICKHCRRRRIKYEAWLVDFAVPKSTVRFGRNRVLSVTVTSIQQSYLDGSISSNCRACRADVWPVVSSVAAVRGFDVGVWGCDVLVNSTRARRLTCVRSVEEERLTPPFSFWSWLHYLLSSYHGAGVGFDNNNQDPEISLHKHTGCFRK